MGSVNTQTFRVLGLDIEFPFQPYGIQKAMMNKVILTLTNKEHSLIESPTGTGKTLVLLCSSLAWQKKSKLLSQPYMSAKLRKIKAEERKEKLLSKACLCGRRSRPELEDEKSLKKAKLDEKEDLKTSPYFQDCITIDDEGEDKAEVKVIDQDENSCCQIIDEIEPDEKPKQIYELEQFQSVKRKGDCDDYIQDKPLCKACAAIEAEEKFAEIVNGEEETCIDGSIKARVPRIYYGTRTHKQITQVIRELNKTPYKKELRICILSSRDRTCINDEVKDQSNRNDLCQELIKGKSAGKSKKKTSGESCPFYSDQNTVNSMFEDINNEFKTEVWDIEDAAKFGHDHHVCPYYGVRSLQASADITFCPYNYLLDPTIRRALDINISNSVIIVDEAHNIEDICRDSASFNTDTFQISDFIDSVVAVRGNYIQGSVISDAYQFFIDRFRHLNNKLQSFQFDSADLSESGDYLAKKEMSELDMIIQLEHLLIGPSEMSSIKENLKAIRGEEDESSDKSKSGSDQTPTLGFNELQLITQLCLVLEFIYGANNKNLSDFRLVITKNIERDVQRRFSKPKTNHDEARTQAYWKLSIFCMNPGIAFEKIHSSAWSVIVASGTLSPIESLKTELGCTFAHVFEGSHVIGKERIFASILSEGPSRVDLNCAWANSLKLDFQDEVGAVIRDVCQTVPNGVLCFFPSYDRLENFHQRWQLKGILRQIQLSGKKLYRERKNLTTAKFEDELSKYHESAKGRGALLFAVYRGKVSEGIDFSDEAARAVITIGIPYPNVKEITVGLKRDYNDVARRRRPHLMPGRDWYASQAFRALNQAVGRCIRHKEDWGAIIMIDSRLRNNTMNISRWLRQSLQMDTDYATIRDSLKHFVDELSGNHCC